MIRFPAVDAALEGFRITREHPMAVLAWGGVLLVVNLVGQAWLMSSGAMGDLVALSNTGMATAPTELVSRLQAAGPVLGVFFVAATAVNVLLYTAVIRSVLQPNQASAGYLRLGVDEVRQLGLMIFIFGVWIVWFTLIEVASVLLFAFANQAPGVAGGLLKAAVLAAFVIAIFYPVVRLSLAPAMTFADGRISLFRSWTMTRGQFWGLFGAYVLAAVLAVLVMLLAALIFAALGALASAVTHGGFDLLSAAQRRDTAPQSLFTPTGLALVAINAVCSTLAFTIVMAVGPSAFRYLSERAEAVG